ncbi:MAG: phosphate ABC transporter permease PstA [Ilumatobacteraceae bacterium]|nr:phosphate ABC transporter permease PstA [Ilumatobacteraceae bacterium]
MSVVDNLAVQVIEAVPTQPWKKPRSAQRRDLLTYLVLALLAYAIVMISGVAGPDGFALVFFVEVLLLTVLRSRGIGKAKSLNAIVSTVIGAGAVAAFAPWMSIFFSLVTKGFHGLYAGFLVSDMRVTTPDDELNMGGVGHAIIGSLLMVLIATAITLPLGILSGVYLTEVRGRLTKVVRFVIQSMSGVPSIVAGLFIYTTVISITGSFSGFAGALALSVLMLPTVARTAEEVLKLVPEDLRAASYALGARQWRSSFMVVLPTVRSGLTTAAILGVARVVGETAPLILTALSNNAFKFNPFDGPIASMPMYVFGMLQIGTEYSISRAWSGSLVLMLIVLALFVVARRLGGKDKR